MRFARSAVLAALALAAIANAQDPSKGPTRIRGNVDAASGRPSLEPAGLRTPGSDWPDAARTKEAVGQGTAALERAARAYQSAKTLVDRATIVVSLPEGRQEERVELDFGESGEFRIAMNGMRLVCQAGKVSFVPDQPADRYLLKDSGGNGHAALRQLLGSFTLPVPDLAFRHPLPDAGPVAAFAGCGVGPDAAVTGFREAGGRQEVLIEGKRSKLVASIDPSSGFVRSIDSAFSPEGLPGEVRIGIVTTMDPVVGPARIAVPEDVGTRKAVATLEEMFGGSGADAPAPNGTAKPGADAPVASLAGLDGKQVDLASLRGKAVVIDFWASWCGPCRRGLPLLQQYYEEVRANDRVAVFAVNVWEQCKPEELVAKVRESCDKLKLTVPVLLDRDGSFIGKYGFQGIPATIVIGPDGKLVSSHMGFAQDMVAMLRADVAKALGTAK